MIKPLTSIAIATLVSMMSCNPEPNPFGWRHGPHDNIVVFNRMSNATYYRLGKRSSPESQAPSSQHMRPKYVLINLDTRCLEYDSVSRCLLYLFLMLSIATTNQWCALAAWPTCSSNTKSYFKRAAVWWFTAARETCSGWKLPRTSASVSGMGKGRTPSTSHSRGGDTERRIGPAHEQKIGAMCSWTNDKYHGSNFCYLCLQWFIQTCTAVRQTDTRTRPLRCSHEGSECCCHDPSR